MNEACLYDTPQNQLEAALTSDRHKELQAQIIVALACWSLPKTIWQMAWVPVLRTRSN